LHIESSESILTAAIPAAYGAFAALQDRSILSFIGAKSNRNKNAVFFG